MFLVLAHGAAHAEQRYALVIGANAGWSQDRPLRFAEHDAERVRDVLVSLGGFAPDRVELMRDPDTADVRAALRRLARTAHDSSSEDTLVFLYYSGHADAQYLHLRGEPLSHRELEDILRSLPATIRLAVIDACKSGAVTQKGGAAASEFDIDVISPKLSGMVLLTSSGADELSQESRTLAGSVFTHHLVSGLRGAADADSDLQVTVAEAYHYAYERTRAHTVTSGTLQRPGFRYELSGQGELVLTRLAVGRLAQLKIPRGTPQRYVILDANEWRLIAEASAEADREVVLSLAPGVYRVKRVLADHLEVAGIVLVPNDTAEIDRFGYQAAPLSRGVVKGEPDGLSPVEQHEWKRAQAFGMLADGQATAALNVFDRLLRETPGDALAWRGRGRALVRMAEAYQRVGDRDRERKALTEALKSDPSLVDDPLFQTWYRRLGELTARAESKEEARRKLRANPRSDKRYGVGFDLISARGLLTLSGDLVLHPMVIATAAFDLSPLGLDAGVTFAPLSSRWSPYLMLAGHVSARKVGFDLAPSGPRASTDSTMYTDDELWGLHGRVEVGAQFVGTSGFTTSLGLGILSFQADSGKGASVFWPVFHFGWMW